MTAYFSHSDHLFEGISAIATTFLKNYFSNSEHLFAMAEIPKKNCLLWPKFLQKVVAMAEIPKKRWSLWLKFLKKVVAMAEIPKKGPCYG